SVLDCDMVPQPDYISAVVPYFEDDRVALVQTPHGFYNTDSFQHYSASRHDQSLFYDVLQRGKDGHNSAYWCGTGGLLRTEALRQVGGVAEDTITEDFHTSVRLHARGWRSRYHPVALTFGLGATDHGTYAGQRDRWGSGNIALLRTSDSPLTVPGLTLRQRISYLATLVAVLAGLRRLCFVIGVALILATARIPFSADPRVLVVLLGTSLVTGTVAVLALGRGRMAVGDLSRGEILALPAQLSALRTLVLGDRGSGVFTVTAKDATVEHWSAFVRSNRALTVLTALLATGVVIGVGRQVTGNGLQTAAALLTFVLAGWEATQLGLAWRFGLRYHQRRTAYRVPVEGRRALIEDGERVVIGRLVDLSPAGAGIEVFDDLEAEVGDVVPFAIDGVPTPVLASICRIAGGDVGLAFEDVPAESGIVIDRVCYVDSITAADVVPEETEVDRSSAQPETGSTEPAEPAEAEPGWPPLRSETWDALRRLAGPPASGPGLRPDGPAETHDRSAVVASRPPGRSAEAGGGSS
ncbi:MAG: glycosyltransferase family 2 protein, partial [Actinomycetota bacterium]